MPLTISLSTLFLFNWTLTAVGSYYGGLMETGPVGVGRLALFVGAFVGFGAGHKGGAAAAEQRVQER